MSQEMMTLKEVAVMLRVKPTTVKNWINSGIIRCPYYRVNDGNNYRFKREDVEKLLVKAGGVETICK